MAHQPLYKRMPHHYEVPVLLVCAVVSLVKGLTLPTLSMKELVFWRHDFSVLTGIQSLYQEKYYFLAGLIFFFSVVFPAIKLLTLTCVWFAPISERTRSACLRCVELLGKWSMLDVFVVAVTVVITKMSGLIKAEPHIGIYVFAFSVLLSMLTAFTISRLSKKH